MAVEEKFIEKLRKILALKERAGTEGEALSASEMLNKLLLKHNLDIADLEARGMVTATHVIEKSQNLARETTPEWKINLADAIAKYYFCESVTNSYARRVLFIGRPENVDSLQLIYNWLTTQIAAISTEERKRYKEENGYAIHNVTWQKGFVTGLIERLTERLEEARHQAQSDEASTALVLHHASEISDHLEEKYGYRKDGKRTKEDEKYFKELEQKRDQQKLDIAAAARGDISDRELWTKYPYLDPEVIAARKAASDKYWSDGRRNRGRRSYYEDDYNPDRDEAARIGRDAGNKINLQPFVKEGEKAEQLK